MRGDGAAPDGRLLNGLIGEGRIGMPLFFVLSGYLIFRPFAAAALDGRPQPRLVPYAVRRGARIIPAYWLVIVLALLALTVLAHPAARPVTDLPAFLLFLQNYSPGTHGAIDAPTWSVTIEMSFYVVVPVLGLLAAAAAGRLRSAIDRRRVLGTACLVLMLVGSYLIGQGTLHGWDPTITDTLPVRMGSFAAGMLVAVLAHGRRIAARRATAMAALGAALIVGEVAARIYELGPASARELLIDTPITVGFALIIGAIATGRPTGAVLMERGPLFRLGAPSYGLYLVHYPVIQVLRSLDAFPQDPLLAVVVVIGISIALAVLSWRFVESPVIDWAHRRLPSRRVPRPAVAQASGD